MSTLYHQTERPVSLAELPDYITALSKADAAGCVPLSAVPPLMSLDVVPTFRRSGVAIKPDHPVRLGVFPTSETEWAARILVAAVREAAE